MKKLFFLRQTNEHLPVGSGYLITRDGDYLITRDGDRLITRAI